MEVTSTLLEKGKNFAQDPSEVFPESKKFFFSSIGKAHLINSLYGIGYTIQIAMLPYLLISSNAGIKHNGYLLTLFSLLQFTGSIFFGRMADMLKI
ncbi:hypothetical protein PFLG_02911 [Plasmodium falciparum RAJ116]|uniref:Uncharacterized protein n=1 Tax=Plasmodium falciparum RAJ116 TaxID=580058 RepID=A0A0L0D0J8_PLAFA|nr:hypothetical protein PFLG_02911 [Plasmodium falciparum RAJ116]